MSSDPSQQAAGRVIDLDGIKRRLPHRYPFLLIDRVLDYTPGESLRAVKNISANEPWAAGHFPDRAIMPGVLLVEAMAQACGLLAFVTGEAQPDLEMPSEAPLFYLVGVDNARFKQPVEPGDSPHMVASLERVIRGIWLFKARVELNDRLIASAGIRCTMRTM